MVFEKSLSTHPRSSNALCSCRWFSATYSLGRFINQDTRSYIHSKTKSKIFDKLLLPLSLSLSCLIPSLSCWLLSMRRHTRH